MMILVDAIDDDGCTEGFRRTKSKVDVNFINGGIGTTSESPPPLRPQLFQQAAPTGPSGHCFYRFLFFRLTDRICLNWVHTCCRAEVERDSSWAQLWQQACLLLTGNHCEGCSCLLWCCSKFGDRASSWWGAFKVNEDAELSRYLCGVQWQNMCLHAILKATYPRLQSSLVNRPFLSPPLATCKTRALD
jgi:hypothetical protein